MMRGEIGRITVTRTLPQDLGHRTIDLYVDGTRVGSLASGDSLTRELPPGAHTLKVHNTLFGKSAAFSVAPGEHVRFETANISGPGTLMAFVMGAALMYLVLRRVTS